MTLTYVGGRICLVIIIQYKMNIFLGEVVQTCTFVFAEPYWYRAGIWPLLFSVFIIQLFELHELQALGQ